MGGRHFTPWLIALLSAITFFGLLDLTFDLAIEAPIIHVVGEIAFLALTLVTAIFLGVGWFRSQRSITRLRATAKRAEVYMAGLGKAIEMQLAEWGLNEGERITALLLLKGMSHKQIAAATGRSESTIRQHAVEIYRKSGLAGRAELSAFFLEDLLLPNPLEPRSDANPDGVAGTTGTRSGAGASGSSAPPP